MSATALDILAPAPAPAPVAPTEREKWLAERRRGIGGSDIGALLGLSAWGTPLTVWADKMGLSHGEPETREQRLGKAAEPLIAAEYKIETGREIRLNSKVYYHPAHEWALGTPDGFTTDEKPLLIECKKAHEMQASKWGPAGSDWVPDSYLVQVTWYLSVCDLPRADLAVLIGGSDFRVYEITRNRDLEAVLLERADAFWRGHVLTGKAPEPIGKPIETKALGRVYPKSGGIVRLATPDEADLMERLAKAKVEAERLKAQLCAAIGEDDGLESPDFRATWRSQPCKKTTAWKAVAVEAKASHELIDKHTTKKGEPYRRLLLTDRTANATEESE